MAVRPSESILVLFVRVPASWVYATCRIGRGICRSSANEPCIASPTVLLAGRTFGAIVKRTERFPARIWPIRLIASPSTELEPPLPPHPAASSAMTRSAPCARLMTAELMARSWWSAWS